MAKKDKKNIVELTNAEKTVKSNKKKKIKEIIQKVILVIAIIIPIAVAFLICRYTYKRHVDSYQNVYFNEVKYDKDDNDLKNINEQVEAYLRYQCYSYKKLSSSEVMYETDKRLATLDIYEITDKTETTNSDDEKVYTYSVRYWFVMYNVNYTYAMKLKVPTGEGGALTASQIPSISIQIRNAEDYDLDTEANNYTLSSFTDVVIYDYDYSPKKDSKGNSVSQQLVQYVEVEGLGLPSDSITVAVHFDTDLATNNPSVPDEAKARYVYTKESPLSVDTLYDEIDNELLSTFTEGCQGKPVEAGYIWYVLGHYWWWEILAALLLTGLLTGAFYIVFTYDEPVDDSKDNKGDKKKVA